MALVITAIVVRWVNAGLTIGEILLLQGIFAFSIIILEIPSGSLSDKWSRKYTLMISTVLIALGIISYGVATSFLEFSIAEIIIGIGFAFKSGTDSALVYDSLLEMKEQDKAQKIFSQASLTFFTSSVINLILGGILGEVSIILPFIIAIGYQFFVFLLLFQIKEPQRLKVEEFKLSMIYAINKLKSVRLIQIVLLISLILGIVLRISFSTYQPFLLGFRFSLSNIGGVLAILNLFAALSALVMRRMNIRNLNYLYLLIGFSYSSVLILGILKEIEFLILAMFLAQLSRGSFKIIIEVLLQENSNSTERATLSSMISAIMNIGYAGVTVLIRILDPTLREVNIIALLMLITISGIVVLLIQMPNQRITKKRMFQEDLSPAGD